MTTKNIFATAAVAALAFPAAASADRPADKPAKPAKPSKTKSVGFAVGGVDLSGLTVTDGKLAGALTLDPTSANKHARTLLKLSKADVAGEKTVEVGTAGDAVRVRFNGLSATDSILPTDRVKVVGKVSGSTLNIRKVTVTRGDTQTDAPKTETTKSESSKSKTRQSPAKQCKGKSKKKAAGERKSAYAKCVSAAAKAQNDAQTQS
jgi:hypothetical protein